MFFWRRVAPQIPEEGLKPTATPGYTRNFRDLNDLVSRGKSFSGYERNPLFLNLKGQGFSETAALLGVEVRELPDRIEVCVHECPAIKHLRAGGREIVPEFCQHCYHLGQARAEAAGLTMRLQGGNGSCRHTFATAAAALPPQDITQIAKATS